MPELLSIEVAIFLCGTFAAAFVTSLSGFAFAMVAAAIWLYALPPPQASALIAAYALIFQGYAVWKLRRLLDPHRLMPFILGSALGIPLGVAALRWASPIYIRLGVGGWSRDEQRAVFQPTGVASFLMIILAFGGIGIITFDTVPLFLVGLPALAIGTWLGWILYGKLDEGAFRRVVLVLLLVSGVALMASAVR